MYQRNLFAEERTQRHFRQREEGETVPSGEPTVQAKNNTPELSDETLPSDYRVTDRLNRNGDQTKYALTDEAGEPATYEDNEKKNGTVFLPEGTKVVKLEQNPLNPDYTKIIVWIDGKYREGFVSTAAFEGTMPDKSDFSVDVFINDAERAIYTAELFYETKRKREEPYFKDWESILAPFHQALEFVKKCVAEYYSGELKITGKKLRSLNKKDEDLLKSGGENKPRTIEKITQRLYEINNPAFDDKQYSERVLVVPITASWMSAYVPEFYKNVWLTNPDASNTHIGGSGDVANDATLTQEIIGVLRQLNAYVQSKSEARGTPEGKWLRQTFAKDTSGYTRIITVHDESWQTKENDMYVSGVPLDNSSGMLKPNPIMSLLVHEMNVVSMGQSSYSMGETHIMRTDTEEAYNEVKSGGLGALNNDPEKTDNLFQSHSSSTILILADYFRRLKN